MPSYAIAQVGPGAQPVWYGTNPPEPFTISNTSPNSAANIWIGNNQSVGPQNPNNSTVIPPGGYVSFDGTAPAYYAVADAANGQVTIYPGVTSFFLPAKSLSGVNFTINANGAFFYLGTPAHGNLIISLVPGTVSVIDNPTLNNTAPPGVTIGNNTSTQINLFSAGTQGFLQILWNNLNFSGGSITGVIGSFAQMNISGPANTAAGHTDFVTFQMNSSDGVSAANYNLVYVDPAGTPEFYATMNDLGLTLFAVAAMHGVLPGTGTSPSNPAQPESWHVVGSAGQPAFQNGWTGSGSAFNGARFRLAPNGAGEVEIQLDIINTTATGNSTVFTLPAGYFKALGPGTNVQISWDNPQPNNAASAPWLFVDGGGNVVVIGIQVANKEIFGVVSVPID